MEPPADAASTSTEADVNGVVARGIRRRFGEVEALRGADLTAPYGEVTAMVGPNGSGKTTLFLVLATLLAPDEGEIEVAGLDPRSYPDEVRAQIGWMPDAFGVYDQLTAREYLRFFGRAYRLTPVRGYERADALLAQVHLEDFADQPVRVLSRGQKQRLGVARALVPDPSVLLLDEPASGLDPRSRLELRELLRRLAGDGAAVLVSSHILSELEEIADGVVVLDRGATAGAYRLDGAPVRRTQAWRIRALEQQPLVSALQASGVSYEPVSPTAAEVELGSDEEAAELLAGLVATGVRVVSCAPAATGIETAYLELTQERG